MMKKKWAIAVAISLVTVASAFAPVQAAGVKFRRPLDTLQSPAVSYYFDHDPAATAIRRYDCLRTTSYDRHQGTDFRVNSSQPVRAGAFGGIFQTVNNCPTYGYLGSSCGDGFGNHVHIDHEGSLTDGQGLTTIYAHMQQFTAANPMTVPCGAALGLPGSSGNSTGPHLHFEVRRVGDSGSEDPYAGLCSRSEALWLAVGTDGQPQAQCW